jgi:hypothetical protein
MSTSTIGTMPTASLSAGVSGSITGSTGSAAACSLCQALSKIKVALSGVAAGEVEMNQELVYSLANQHVVTQIIFLWTIYCTVGYVFNKVLEWAFRGTR